MCEEINAEIRRGKGAAEILVDHMISMGSNGCRIPVNKGSHKYHVTAYSEKTRVDTVEALSLLTDYEGSQEENRNGIEVLVLNYEDFQCILQGVKSAIRMLGSEPSEENAL